MAQKNDEINCFLGRRDQGNPALSPGLEEFFNKNSCLFLAHYKKQSLKKIYLG